MDEKTKLKNKKLKALQEMFAAKLPTTMAAISDEWQKLAAQLPDKIDAEEFHRLIHTLAGTAGSFGFSSLGKKAKTIEILVVALCKEPEDKSLFDNIEKGLVQLQSIAFKEPTQVHDIFKADKSKNKKSKSKQYLIYFLEDDELLAARTTKQLEYFGYVIKHFIASKELLAAVEEKKPDLFLIDIHLPEGETAGPDTIKLIREQTEENIPVVFLSSDDSWNARLKSVRAGGQAYLLKPLDFQELVEQLDLLTGKKKQQKYRILIVDDTELLAEHYATVLQLADMEVKVVNRPHNLLEILPIFSPDLILMDLYMPGCSGFEATKIIRQTSNYTNIPIVYLSTEKGIEEQLDAMQIGGDDFLQKPIKDEHLVKAVGLRAKRFRALTSLMNKDSLTGLLNNINIKLALEREISLSVRNAKVLSFVMIDIDHFKKVNDTYGHPEGDKVIKTLARLLDYRLRKGDISARYGGEEFAIILPETKAEEARKVVDSIRARFSQIKFQYANKTYSVTLSAGIATCPDISSMQELIAAADKALYESKNNGRNQVTIYTKDESET